MAGEWGEIVIDVPAGMRLMLDYGSLDENNQPNNVILRDVQTGSKLRVHIVSGEFRSRSIVEGDAGARGAKGAVGTGSRDVNAIFDQIEESARRVEPPVFD